MGLRHGLSGLVVAAGLLVAQSAQGVLPEAELDSSWRLALHGGWWDAGVDLTSPGGVLFGVGVPWVLYLPGLGYSGRDGLVAADASVGYRASLSAQTSLYGRLLTVWEYDWGNPCSTGCTEHTHRLYFLPVMGIRQHVADTDTPGDHTAGAMFGIDLALAVWSVHHTSDEATSGWRRKNIPAWAGIAFSQVYAGYEW